MRKLYSLPFLLALLFAVGCGGDGRGRMAIEGKVTYDGQPLENGEIIFEPQAPNLPMAVGQIANGAYKIDAKFGPAVGSYKVRIDGYRMKPDPNMRLPSYAEGAGQPVMVREQIVPLKYKTDPLLTVEIVAGTTVYPFDIPANP